MRVGIFPALNDNNLDARVPVNQRQLSISVEAIAEQFDGNVPLNICLILDHSGSMSGEPLETVKESAKKLIEKLKPGDRISVVAFDHKAKVIVPNQEIDSSPRYIFQEIDRLKADGGTCIDEGLKFAIEELAKGKQNAVSHGFLLTDGENEHGDNEKCIKFANLAVQHGLTLNTLGFGENWNQNVLEKIADAGGGTMRYIERANDATSHFSSIFERVQSIGLTNAYLLISFMSGIKLSDTKPIAQVAPDTIELPVVHEGNYFVVRMGDLMKDMSRVILANIYINQLPEGKQNIAQIEVRYDDPAKKTQKVLSESVTVQVNVLSNYQPAPNPDVQRSVLALAKYRQTQIAEEKLQKGDRAGAATMLQTAAKTALQMGDKGAATVLQSSATQLQTGEDLSEADRKRTRIVSKTILQ
jgi:Ca-activated chloride channel homolog